MPTTKVNGISIYYEVRGNGKPVLLIAGLANDLTQLGGLIGRLAEKRRVISFDSRGVGRSDKPDTPYTIEMMGDDAAGVLGSLGIPSADIIGVSLGGRVALMVALEHPELVARLVLVSTSARMSYHRGAVWWLSNQLVRIPQVRGVGTKYPQPYYAYVRQRDASKGFDVTGRLKEIERPTLVLHGKTDRVVPFKLAEEMNSAIPGSKLVPCDGGHLSVFSKPDMVASEIERFLESS